MNIQQSGPPHFGQQASPFGLQHGIRTFNHAYCLWDHSHTPPERQVIYHSRREGDRQTIAFKERTRTLPDWQVSWEAEKVVDGQ